MSSLLRRQLPAVKPVQAQRSKTTLAFQQASQAKNSQIEPSHRPRNLVPESWWLVLFRD